MIKEKDVSKNMSKDIDEMEGMFNDYLQFAKTQAKENTPTINLSNLFIETKKDLKVKILT